MDVIFYEGETIDIGEAVAETLSLSLDPYPRAPGAETVLQARPASRTRKRPARSGRWRACGTSLKEVKIRSPEKPGEG